jgi:hypothetical protein
MISLRTYLLGDAEKDVEASYRRMPDLFLRVLNIGALRGGWRSATGAGGLQQAHPQIPARAKRR